MSRWVVAAGALVVSLDSMMNIAFPAIAAALGVPPERVRWIIIFYVLTYAVMSFAGGAAADRLGHALVFRSGLALSALAFIMGGVAAGLGWLLAARIIQGLGAGLVFGTAPALVTAGVPSEARGRRLGFLNGAMGLGALGPLVAGFLVDGFGWRAVFHVRVPLALGVLGWAVRASSAPVVSERRPVAIGDLARGGVLRASVLAFVARGAIFAIWLLVPFYLVDTRGLGASVGGIFFMLTPLGTAVAAPVGGRVADRIGASAPAVAGLVLQTAGLGVLGFVDGATPLWLIALALFVAGFGLGFFEVPNMTTIMGAFPAGRQGAAGGLAFLTRTLGVVAGVALLGELIAARSATVGFLVAFDESLRASALAVAAALVFALAAGRARR
jgi:MFS family permease